MKHDQDSVAEGYPFALKIQMPNYIAYTNTDSFATNYTLPGNPDPVIVYRNVTPGSLDASGNSFEVIFFEIPTFLFADIISFNFSLTVDPTAVRLEGSGQIMGTIVLSPQCQQNIINGYPAADTVVKQCGDMSQIPITVETPGERNEES